MYCQPLAHTWTFEVHENIVSGLWANDESVIGLKDYITKAQTCGVGNMLPVY